MEHTCDFRVVVSMSSAGYIEALCGDCGRLRPPASGPFSDWLRENLETTSDSGEMPLHVAAKYGDSFMLQVYLQYKGDWQSPYT